MKTEGKPQGFDQLASPAAYPWNSNPLGIRNCRNDIRFKCIMVPNQNRTYSKLFVTDCFDLLIKKIF